MDGAAAAAARVTASSARRVTGLDDALERAFAHDGPALVEVMTDADLV